MDRDERFRQFGPALALMRGEAERQLVDVMARHTNMHTRAAVAVAAAAVIGVGGGVVGGEVLTRMAAGVFAVASAVFAVWSLLLEKSPASDMSSLSEAKRTMFLEGGAYATEYRIWIDQLRTLRNGHSDLVRKGRLVNVSFILTAVGLIVAIASAMLTATD